MRRRRVGEWENWVASVQRPRVAQELRGFTEGLMQDEAAVKAVSSQDYEVMAQLKGGSTG